VAKHYTNVAEILDSKSQIIIEDDVKLFFGDDKVACGGDFQFIYYDPICLVDSCGGNVYWWEVMDSASEHHLSEKLYIPFESGCIQSPITEKKYPKRYATQEVALTFQHGGEDDPQPGAFINLAVFWDVMALLGKARDLDKYTEQRRMRKV